MSNDGWGKLPTNDDWSKQKDDGWPTSAQPTNSWPAPAVSDDWVRNAAPGPLTPKPDPWAPISTAWPEIKMAPATPAISNGWGEWADKPVQDWLTPTREEIETKREEQWTHSALEGASNRAAVVNSLRGVKDEYTIDTDGELSNITETVHAKKTGEPTGWYLAYSNGKWLHAILSGPYPTAQEALLRTEQAWDKFTNDGAFKLAFDNKFNRDGIYCAEIPLSLKRHGAYGVLT